jgi:hypothetical protein
MLLTVPSRIRTSPMEKWIPVTWLFPTWASSAFRRALRLQEQNYFSRITGLSESGLKLSLNYLCKGACFGAVGGCLLQARKFVVFASLQGTFNRSQIRSPSGWPTTSPKIPSQTYNITIFSQLWRLKKHRQELVSHRRRWKCMFPVLTWISPIDSFRNPEFPNGR